MRKKTIINTLLLTILLVSVLFQGTSLPLMGSYLIATLVYLIVLAVRYYRGDLRIRYDPLVLVPIVILWSLFVVGVLRIPRPHTELRFVAYVVFSGINLFIIPATFSSEEFINALALVATLVSLITIPIALPAIVFHTESLGIERNGSELIFTSIFTNQNYLSALSTFGLVAVFGITKRSNHNGWILVGVLICSSGLILSGGRAAFLGAVGGICIMIIQRYATRRTVTLLVCGGIVAGISLFIVAVTNALGPHTTRHFFTHRAGLWRAALRAIGDRPYTGWGPVDDGPILGDHGAPAPHGKVYSAHNSFLRMFLMTGIIGGVTYLGLCGVVLGKNLLVIDKRSEETRSLNVLLPLLVVVFALELFGNAPIFGLSFISVIGALVFGFSQNPSEDGNPTFS